MKSIRTHKKLLFLLIGLLFIVACAAERVVKKSQRHRPDWVYGMMKDYFISSGVGKSFEEAQANALINLKDMVIRSIAVQVVSKSTSNTNETMSNEVADYLSTYENNIQVYSEYFKPLKGLSASNVESFYWEVVKTEDGDKDIRYHIKYPFSQSELNELIRDFELLDAEMDSKLEAIENRESHYESIEQIIESIRSVDNLMATLPRSKKKRAISIKEELEATLDDISFIVLDDSSGFLSYELRLYGEPLSVSKAPDIYASCPIRIVEFKAFAYKSNVAYDRSKCPEDNDEKLSVEYKYSDQKVKRSFVIPAKYKAPDILKVENMSIENLGLGAGICRFSIQNNSNQKLLIETIGLSFYEPLREGKRTRVELAPFAELEPNKKHSVEQRFRFPFKKSVSVLRASVSNVSFLADLELKREDGQIIRINSVPLKFSL